MTKKLYPINQRKLSNVESALLTGRTIDDIDQSGIKLNTDENIPLLISPCRSVLNTFKKSMEQVRGSDKTASLAKLDKERDNAVRALLSAHRAFRYSKRESEQAAYISLKLLFDQYRSVMDKHYDAQTLVVSNLVDKLGTAPYREQINQLGLKRFDDNLTDSNRRFDVLYASRNKEKMGKVAEKTGDLKEQLLFNYSLLADYINIMAQVKKTKFYLDLLAIVNHHRKLYAEILARKSKPKKEELRGDEELDSNERLA
jgi:hypothetical protein